jgi:hypothetical protein
LILASSLAGILSAGAEHQVLLAAVTLAAGSGFDSHAWQLPWAMVPFLQTRGHFASSLTLYQRLGNPSA